MVFYDKESYDFPIEPFSMIVEDENVDEISDQDLWAEYWDLSEVRRFRGVNVPGMYVD